MSEAKKTEQLLYKEKETEKEKQGEKRNRIITISVAAFLTFCCCAFFFFFLLRNQEFAAYGAQIFGILQPIIIGIVLAYLLNPIMVFIEMRVIKVLNQYIKNEIEHHADHTLLLVLTPEHICGKSVEES